MTPKEKALELCNKFMICNTYQAIVWHNAIICVTILVNEVLELDDFSIYGKVYWQEVRKEIEKL